MSVEEQPIENNTSVQTSADETEGISFPAQKLYFSKAVRDTIIAGAVLLISAGAAAVFFQMSKKQTGNSDAATPVVSAVGWFAGDTETVSPSHEIDNSQIVQNGYAPTPLALSDNETEEPETSEESFEENGVRKGTVKSGVPVISSLQKLGLTIQQAHAIISALKGIYDFRRARPGETFELYVNDSKEPSRLVYHASLTEVYVVEKKGGEFKGRKKHIPTTKKMRQLGGTIASSLYKALSDLGANPSLAGKIVGILANEVNFYKEQRPGDTFRVIVEEESLDGTFLGYGPVLALEYQGVKSGKKRFFRFEAEGRESEYFSEKGISQPRSAMAIPLNYTRISSPFGLRIHPVLKRKLFHNGVDFVAGTGDPVWACQEGTVTIAEKKGANGNLVGIKHSGNLESYYAHLYRFASGIKAGVSVKKRQVVGYVGNTGRSTGPHLHFGVKLSGKFIDPLKYRIQPGRPIEARYKKELDNIISERNRLLDKTAISEATEPLADLPEHNDDVIGDEEW